MSRPIICLVNKSPLPTSTGSRLRIWNLLCALAEEHQIYLVIVAAVTTAERTLLDAHPQLRPVYLGTSDADLAGQIGALATYREAAAVWVSGVWAEPIVSSNLTMPVIVDLQSREEETIRAEIATAVRRLPRPKAAISLMRSIRHRRRRIRAEHTIIARAALVTTCAPSDIVELNRPGAPPVVLVPNGTATGRSRRRAVGSQRLLFVGTLHYGPNADAAEWLTGPLLLAIRKSVPGATVHLVGAFPPSIRALADRPGVELHGFVDDLAEHYAQSELVIAPLRSGSGTKTKILEAFAHGVPVVTTPVGIEGLDVTPCVHAAVATDAASLTAHVVRLLADPAAADAQAEAAVRLVNELYDWTAIGAALRASVNRVLV